MSEVKKKENTVNRATENVISGKTLSIASDPEVRVYVDVLASFSHDGVMMPRIITWEDGRRYLVDKVVDIRPAEAANAGGQGDRYTIWLHGEERHLFFERNFSLTGNYIGRWFVERRMAS